MAWVLLAAAIVCELSGTLALRRLADGAVWWAIVIVAVSYLASFTCMAFALRQLNVAVVYAIWSAVGTAAIAIAGAVLFDERLGMQAIVGMALVVIGVGVLVGSGTVRHG